VAYNEYTTGVDITGWLSDLAIGPARDVSENELPAVVKRMETKIDTEAPAESVEMLWTTTYLLMGLKYEPKLTRQVLQGVGNSKPLHPSRF